jgi:hypothetical protein
MHTVIETPAYLRAAAGLSERDRDNVVTILSRNPQAGDLMPGTGGCRKLRIAPERRGKRGGYRIITYFGGNDVPVFLITVFSKGERADLSRAERNALGVLAKTLVESLSRKVVKIGAKR